MLCFRSNVFDATFSLGSVVITLDVLLLLKWYTKQTTFFFLSFKYETSRFQCL